MPILALVGRLVSNVCVTVAALRDDVLEGIAGFRVTDRDGRGLAAGFLPFWSDAGSSAGSGDLMSS